MLQKIVSGGLMLIIGLILLFCTKQVYKSTMVWQSKEKSITPSKSYLIVVRCVGVFIGVVGILVMFGVLK